MRREDVRQDADEVTFEVIRVGDQAADEIGTRTRNLGDEMADQPAGARFDAGDPQPELAAARSEAFGGEDQVGRVRRDRTIARLGVHGYAAGSVRAPSAGRTPRLRDAGLAEGTERGAVQRELRHAGRPGPDLDRLVPLERQRLAVRDDLPGGPDLRRELAVDPDLDPGSAALDRDGQVDALEGDTDVAASARSTSRPGWSRSR